MSYHEIIKAWKDPEYRAHLSNTKRALLPENPAGLIELNDDDLNVAGAGGITNDFTITRDITRLCCIQIW